MCHFMSIFRKNRRILRKNARIGAFFGFFNGGNGGILAAQRAVGVRVQNIVSLF